MHVFCFSRRWTMHLSHQQTWDLITACSSGTFVCPRFSKNTKRSSMQTVFSMRTALRYFCFLLSFYSQLSLRQTPIRLALIRALSRTDWPDPSPVIETISLLIKLSNQISQILIRASVQRGDFFFFSRNSWKTPVSLSKWLVLQWSGRTLLTNGNEWYNI